MTDRQTAPAFEPLHETLQRLRLLMVLADDDLLPPADQTDLKAWMHELARQAADEALSIEQRLNAAIEGGDHE